MLEENHIVVRETPTQMSPRSGAHRAWPPTGGRNEAAAVSEVLFKSHQSSRGSRTHLAETLGLTSKRAGPGPCLGEAYKKKRKRKEKSQGVKVSCAKTATAFYAAEILQNRTKAFEAKKHRKELAAAAHYGNAVER